MKIYETWKVKACEGILSRWRKENRKTTCFESIQNISVSSQYLCLSNLSPSSWLHVQTDCHELSWQQRLPLGLCPCVRQRHSHCKKVPEQPAWNDCHENNKSSGVACLVALDDASSGNQQNRVAKALDGVLQSKPHPIVWKRNNSY